jgi:ppGpp synthetase/RelA/SpoT-type nucleotidyltranferase
MPESALPMSKTALDRLGARLAAGDQIDDADRETLARVVDVYQQVLDDVKAELTALGHEATTRVKTTGTLVEKLRREHRMRLSQVQDLAGARIIVSDRPTQDDVAATLRRHFEASGHACKEVDRRKDPSHGYRALHLVVSIASVLVEIQIRTDLEDTWAQIVERLADRWGRGIRYGDDPADPEAQVRAGQRVITRREAVAFLIDLGAAIGSFELSRGMIVLLAKAGELFDRLVAYADQFPQAHDPRPISELPADEQAGADMVAAGLAIAAPFPEIHGALADPRSMSVAQVFQVLRMGLTSIQQENQEMLGQLRASEQELRDTLQLIASATGEGE